MPRNPGGKGGGSEKRITAKVSAVLDHYISDMNISIAEAGRRAGMTERAAQTALAKPHVQAELHRRLRKRISGHSLRRAVLRLDQLINAESEYVAADVAKHIMAIEGVRPASDGSGGTGRGTIQMQFVINGQVQSRLLDALNGAESVQPIEHSPQAIEDKRG